MIKRELFHRLTIALLVALSSQVLASELTVVDGSDNDINISVMPAQGELLAIWFVDHIEERLQFENMLRAINRRGIEVWRVDLLADYFLPRSSESVRTLGGEGVAAVIAKAHQYSKKNIVLAAYDRMPLPLLRGVREWQRSYRGESRLEGAMLFYPNLFGPPPLAGEDPDLDPVVRATNIPVTLYQPEYGTHRWRLGDVLEGLREGGSPVYTYMVPNVRDWFFMHPRGDHPNEDLATDMVPDKIIAFSRLMGVHPKPAAVVSMKNANEDEAQIQELVALAEPKQAIDFELEDISGKPHRLDDYRGTVLLVNFWATWCPPCVDELPSLNALIKRYSDKQFSVVSIDFRESKEVIEKFTEQVSVNFPVLMDGDGRTSLEWKVFSFPSSFLIDRQGNIRYSANRAIDWNTPEVWRAIDKLLDYPK